MRLRLGYVAERLDAMLRADPKLATTTVVVLTSSELKDDELDADQLRIAGYLVKPLTFPKLVDLMDTLDKRWALVESS